MEVNEARRLKLLEEENRRLKEMVADLSLDREAPPVFSDHRFQCSTYRYEAQPDDNVKLRADLIELARQKPRYGYRRLWAILAKRGEETLNVKRVNRIYREENLTVRRLKRKRVTRAAPAESNLTAANQEWAVDFVSDSLSTGRGVRSLTIVDSFTRECPAIWARRESEGD